MKKSIRKYLEERRDMVCHNLYCFSRTYAMDTPAEGKEKEFAEALRDLEIVDELILITEEYPTSDNPDIEYPKSLAEVLDESFPVCKNGGYRDRSSLPVFGRIKNPV